MAFAKRVNLDYDLSFKTKPFRAGLGFEYVGLYELDIFSKQDGLY